MKSKKISKLNKLGRIIRKVKKTIITINNQNQTSPTYVINESFNSDIKKINKTVSANFSEKIPLFAKIPHQGHVG